MKKSSDYKIEYIERATYGDSRRQIKTFKAYQWRNDQRAWVFVGGFTAPASIKNDDLWKVVDARLEEVEETD